MVESESNLSEYNECKWRKVKIKKRDGVYFNFWHMHIKMYIKRKLYKSLKEQTKKYNWWRLDY